MRDNIQFYLNGREQIVRGEDAFITLSEYLRMTCGLVGTKVVCAEGDCGACTALVGKLSGDRMRYVPIDSCIQFVHQLDGTHVVSVEALPENGRLHPVQDAMADHHGAQCGYCTPGIVMALTGWAEAGANTEEMRLALTGNLCRCTGYVPILEAAKAVSRTPLQTISQRFQADDHIQKVKALGQGSVRVETKDQIYFAPATLEEAIAYKASHPQAVIVAGATELGVWRNKQGMRPAALLSLARISSLDVFEVKPESMSFGANVTWAQVEQMMRERLPEFHRIIQRFGSPQIRHAATLVGNVANGSPIADSLGLFSVMDAEVEMIGPNGARRRSINGFYTGYKKKDLRDDEIITRITLPMPGPDERLRLYKVSRRNDLDIATFGAAIRMQTAGDTIQSAAIAYTGVAATVVRLAKTEAFLVGRSFQESTFRQAGRIARDEIAPLTDVRGSKDFRWQLAQNILPKFYFDEAGVSTSVGVMS